MPSTVRCWTLPRAALAAATIFLTGCAGVGSDVGPGVCPPVVEYSRAEQARVAEEVTALPEGAMIVVWLADYAVLRDQVRDCKQFVHVLFFCLAPPHIFNQGALIGKLQRRRGCCTASLMSSGGNMR